MLQALKHKYLEFMLINSYYLIKKRYRISDCSVQATKYIGHNVGHLQHPSWVWEFTTVIVTLTRDQVIVTASLTLHNVMFTKITNSGSHSIVLFHPENSYKN